MPFDKLIFDRAADETPLQRDFKFDYCFRNAALMNSGTLSEATTKKTGTTIVAVTYKDGVVFGADSRATSGNWIADKECVKVHMLSRTIFACGTGTSADLDQVTKMMNGQLTLLQMNNADRPPLIVTAVHRLRQYLFRYMGHVGAHLLVGGVDVKGVHLYTLSASGYGSSRPYAADGSGSYAAEPYLELNWKKDMSREEAVKLVEKALEAGMHNDVMSGNSYRLTIVSKDGVVTNVEPFSPQFATRPEPNDIDYKFAKNSTMVLKEKTFRRMKYDVVDTEPFRKKDMSKEEAVKLVEKALEAGMPIKPTTVAVDEGVERMEAD